MLRLLVSRWALAPSIPVLAATIDPDDLRVEMPGDIRDTGSALTKEGHGMPAEEV